MSATLGLGAAELLPRGSTAPQFRALSVLHGKPSSFDLHDALRSGAVVLYFFPKAFTAG
jgi:peroxiredoxin